MADPQRSDAPPPADQARRESQMEALLVEGLEAYFQRRYEDAIHVWTRVLFLDRNHTRARAYIERAQSAVAERQRSGEEKLQAGQQLLDQGQTDAARTLLREAVTVTGDDDRATALRSRLERMERAQGSPGRPAVALEASLRADHVQTPARRRWTWGIVTAAVVVLAFGAFNPDVRGWLGLSGGGEALAAPAQKAALPMLSTSEVQLVRARTLYSKGRLAEALQALDRVGIDSASRAQADALRIEIQRLLLASAQQRSPGGLHP